MPTPATVDEYFGGLDPAVAERLRHVRAEIIAAVSAATGEEPEERIRYGMPAVMLGGRYAIHYAGWKKHIGLYPVPVFDEPLESEVAPHRSEKDSVVFPHASEIPYDLVARIASAIAAQRVAARE
ncbi:iron chaperone [Microbacterium insulae]|uniref:Iron chaperone n=1 Tax=Microbacterium insulae TaxID=483014 RepID=A0ABW3AL43_9MICO